jgi:hypothetical protein
LDNKHWERSSVPGVPCGSQRLNLVLGLFYDVTFAALLIHEF